MIVDYLSDSTSAAAALFSIFKHAGSSHRKKSVINPQTFTTIDNI